jgi:hypothetical protein
VRLKLSRLDFNHSPPPTWSRPLHSSLKDTFLLSNSFPFLSAFRCTHVTRILRWSFCPFACPRIPPLFWFASSLVHSRHALFVLSTGCIEDLRFSPEFIRVMTVHLGAQPPLHQVPLFGLVGRCVSSFFTSFHVVWGVRDKSSPFRWDVMRGTQFFFFLFKKNLL